MSKVVESVIEDEFSQQLTEHEVLSVINRERNPPQGSMLVLKKTSTLTDDDVFKIIESISENTPEIEFRMLGY